MTDVFSVTFVWSQTTPYAAGSTMTGTISGGDVLTATTNVTVGPLTLTLTAADGSTQTLTTSTATAQMVTSTPESVKITGVVDNSATPLVWTIASSGLSVSAVAP